MCTNKKQTSDMLEYLEAKFGKNYIIPKQGLDTEMIEAVSIGYQIVKSKELNVLDTRLDSQSNIGEVLSFVINSY